MKRVLEAGTESKFLRSVDLKLSKREKNEGWRALPKSWVFSFPLLITEQRTPKSREFYHHESNANRRNWWERCELLSLPVHTGICTAHGRRLSGSMGHEVYAAISIWSRQELGCNTKPLIEVVWELIFKSTSDEIVWERHPVLCVCLYQIWSRRGLCESVCWWRSKHEVLSDFLASTKADIYLTQDFI